MSVEWPKKKECPYHDIKTSKVNCGTCKEARVHNACHDAFMKVIESKELHPDTTDWNKGGKLALEFLNKSQPQDETIKITNADDFDSGMKKLKEFAKSKYGDNVKCNCSSQPQLIPLDNAKVEMIRNLVNWPKHDLKFGMKSHKLTVGEERDLIRYFNSIFGTSKEKLVPICGDFRIKYTEIIARLWKELINPNCVDENCLRRAVKSMDELSAKYGLTPQSKEVTVNDIRKIIDDKISYGTLICAKSIAQAIHLQGSKQIGLNRERLRELLKETDFDDIDDIVDAIIREEATLLEVKK